MNKQSLLCGRMTKRCRAFNRCVNPTCRHKYTSTEKKLRRCPDCKEARCSYIYSREDYDLDQCPKCGEPRACDRPVKVAGHACSKHGGGSPKGPESPHYQAKGWSKYLPSQIAALHEQAKTDEELITVKDHIRLTDTLLADILQRFSGTDSLELWTQTQAAFRAFVKELQQQFAAFRSANAKKDAGKMVEALEGIASLLYGNEQTSEIFRLIETGNSDLAVRQEVYRNSEIRRRLTETELKIETTRKFNVPIMQVMLLLESLAQAAIDRIPDQEGREAVKRTFLELTNLYEQETDLPKIN